MPPERALDGVNLLSMLIIRGWRGVTNLRGFVMAGISITRRRKAWLKGVACGATGRGKCLLRITKLVEIFEKGVLYGRANVKSPLVRAVVEQHERQHRPAAPKPMKRRPPTPQRGPWGNSRR
jgi:hypothetical protein